MGSAFGVLAAASWRWAIGWAAGGGGRPAVVGRRVSLVILLHFILLTVIIWPYRQTISDIWGAGGLAAGILLGLAWVARRER
ncbi:hypothetical protein IIA16_02905 [bacterium]|nr:hypothetical protein [bacterium]